MASGRLAWFHPFAGIAGDMALGSLIDAGAPVEEVAALIARLGVPGISLHTERVLRAGLSATRAHVRVEDDETSRSHAAITALLGDAALPERVATRAGAVFAALAEVEGALHGVPPSEVHFHEVGGHDALADVVGTAAALELLGVDEIRSGPVAMGIGSVTSAHGVLPNPPPAVLALLKGAPVFGRQLSVELTTPTGAAILSALCSAFGPLPPMTPEATGYGAGGRDLEGLPNVTQVVIGNLTGGVPESLPAGQPLVLLEANLDDVTGERLADALAALLADGALDAWITPVVMKKGRPGHLLSALTEPAAAARLRAVLLAESGSFGVRASVVDRFATARTVTEVAVGEALLRVKAGAGRAKVEHDDAIAAARLLGIGLDEVVSRAEEAYRRTLVDPGNP